MDDIHRLGQIIWETSRADESTISYAGANIVARAILASDWLAGVRAQARREALSEAAQGLSDKMRFFEPASEMDIGFYDAHMSIVRTLRRLTEEVGGGE